MVYFLLLLLPALVFVQTYYPTLTSERGAVNVEDAIDKIMAAKYSEIDSQKAKMKDIEILLGVYTNLQTILRNLHDANRSLFDYRSPFSERIALSDNPALSILAKRGADIGNYEVLVKQLAAADVFASRAVPTNETIAPGVFRIQVGKQSFEVTFEGGSLLSLQTAIANASSNTLDARIVSSTMDSQVLQLAVKQTGKKHRLEFAGELVPLLQIAVLGNRGLRTNEYDLDFLQTFTREGTTYPNETWIQLEPESSFTGTNFPASNQSLTLGTQLRYDWLWKPLPPPEETASSNTAGPVLTNGAPDKDRSQTVTIGGLKLSTGGFITGLPEVNPSVSHAVTEESNTIPDSQRTNTLMLQFKDGSKATFPLNPLQSNGVIALKDHAGKELQQLTLHNRFAKQEMWVSNIHLVIPDEPVLDQTLEPLHPISRAQDAILELGGVEVVRSDNEITNLIKDVTLTLKQASDQMAHLSVQGNTQLILERITNWVNAYNSAMQYLWHVKQVNMDQTELSERPEDEQELGALQTDFAVRSLSDTLKQVPPYPYPTRYGDSLKFMVQIGIFTKRPGSFDTSSSDWQMVQRGLLSIDMEDLTEALQTRAQGVQELFYNPTQAEKTGVSVQINQILEPALSHTGFLARRFSENERRLQEEADRISKMEAAAEIYEQKERQELMRMNNAIEQGAQQRNYLNSQFNNKSSQ